MDVSGGSGQPRSGNDESAEPREHPTAPAADPADTTRPEPTGPTVTGPTATDPGTPDHETSEAGTPVPESPATGAPTPTERGGTSAGPSETPAGPGGTSVGPGGTPAGPGGTPAGPGETSAGRGETSAGRGETSAGRGETSAEPGGTPAGRGETSVGPGKTPAGPGKTPAGPEQTPAEASAPRDEPGRNAPGTAPGTPDPGARPAEGTDPDAPRTGDTPPDAAPTPQRPPRPDSPAESTPAAGHGTAGGPPKQPAAGDDAATRPPAGPSAGAESDAGNPHHRTEAHTPGGGGPGRPPQRRPEPGGGLLMGRPFGVPVYVAPSWFLVAALITWVFGGQLDRVLPELGAARYLVSLFFAVAFYASVLVHELAHTVAALRFKLPVRRIQLQFFGGVSEIEKEAETPGREFMLAFVGPLLSLVLSGVFYAALLPVEPDSVPGVLLAGLMVSNLIVAVFNLLPGLPLDGGRMLRAVVWKLTGKPMSGTVAAAWVGRALAIAVLIGLPLATQSLGSNAADDVGMDTVLDALLAAILAAIIWTGAGNSLRMARLREHLPELRARALTRRAVPVQADTPLSEALRRANASGARALVVVDADGTPASLVREAAIVGVPEHRRPWVAVSTLAQDLTDGMRVSAELSGEELLDALRANPATEYLVVEETGEIYGVLSAADVERAFVKAMARPS
ncbi:site-2 protease family protein [Streptomyces sp. NPDC101133]|uniref:site-2 protease family protein n=1 Tax=Streptomyces sp. NPDC101133 TaxID=3366111 RepID=UPI0037F31426